jgi:hypothetical protein
LFPLFATGVVDTVCKLVPAANLPPVSITPAVLVVKFASGVIDTGAAVNLDLAYHFQKSLERP